MRCQSGSTAAAVAVAPVAAAGEPAGTALLDKAAAAGSILWRMADCCWRRQPRCLAAEAWGKCRPLAATRQLNPCISSYWSISGPLRDACETQIPPQTSSWWRPAVQAVVDRHRGPFSSSEISDYLNKPIIVPSACCLQSRATIKDMPPRSAAEPQPRVAWQSVRWPDNST